MNYMTAIVQLPLVRETTKEAIHTPADVARVCMDIAELAQESFHVLMLNAKNTLIDRQLVSIGVADSSLVHAREVFRQAILSGASCIVLAHNHPSGDAHPSAEDLRITRQLIEVGKVIEIRVMDHIIIGRPAENRKGYCSLREMGLCVFPS